MSAEPWEALIVGGPYGIAARLTGRPRKLSRAEQDRLRDTLADGFSIQVLCPDRRSLERGRDRLYRQLGIASA